MITSLIIITAIGTGGWWLASRNQEGAAPTPIAPRASTPAIRISDARSFDALVAQARVSVLVDFNSKACAPCALLSPVLENYASANPAKALVLSVDVVQLPDLAGRFQAEELPLVVRLDHGAETARFTGVKNAAELAAWMATAKTP